VPLLEETEHLYEQLGDLRGVGDASWALGFSLLADMELEAAERHARKASEIAHQLNDPFRIGWTGHVVGSMLAYKGEYEQAEAVFREAIEVFRATGDQGGIGMLLLDTALLAQARGDRARAWRLFGALETLREKSGIASSDAAFFDVGTDEFFWRLPDPPTDPSAKALRDEGSRLSFEEAVALALPDASSVGAH
jgi:tetratricopeptide (TPR) repeat protein